MKHLHKLALPKLPNTDFEECAKEDIEHLNLVQSYGATLICDRESGLVIGVSDNSRDILATPPQNLLKKHVSECLIAKFSWQQALGEAEASSPIAIKQVKLPHLKQDAEVLIHLEHLSDSKRVIVEIVPMNGDWRFGNQMDAVTEMSIGLHQLDHCNTVVQVAHASVELIQSLSGYDRVMLYRFADDWSGEVIAEACAQGLESRFLGIHFPATDIPPQARKLYEKNLLRVIADVDAPGSAIMVMDETDISFNQSFCFLRRPPEVHLMYCRNMGVKATMTLSIMHEGKLWGMLACHHNTTRSPPHELRQSVLLLCRVMSYTISARLASLSNIQDLKEKQRMLEILNKFKDDYLNLDELQSRWPTVLPYLTHITKSSAAILHFDETYIGARPAIAPGLKRLCESCHEHTLVIDHRDQLPDKGKGLGTATGALVVPLEKFGNAHLIFLRDETIFKIPWGGDPSGKITLKHPSGKESLGPRHSFDQWIETVHDTCAPWETWTLDFATRMGEWIGQLHITQQLTESDKKQLLFSKSLDQLNDIVIILEANQQSLMDSSILYSNHATTERMGFNPEEIKGQAFSSLIKGKSLVPKGDATFDKIREQTLRLLCQSKNNSSFWGEMNLSPNLNPKGEIENYVVVIRDITNRILSEQKLREQRDFLENVTNHVPGIVVQLERAPWGIYQVTFINGNVKALLDCDPGVKYQPQSVLNRFTPRAQKKILIRLERSAKDESEINLVLKTRDQKTWLEFHAIPYRQADGKTLWFGFVHDATARISKEQSIEHLTADLNATLNAIPDILIELDLNQQIVACHGTQHLFSSDQITAEHNISEILGKDNSKLIRKAIKEATRNETSCGNEIELETTEKRTYFNISIAAKRKHDGVLVGFILLLRDVTAYKDAELKIKELAYKDSLTGLLNRAAFFDRFLGIQSECKRRGTWYAILYIDLDRFKFLNDTKGHHHGDLLLRTIGERLRSSIREEDALARIGGDEFVLLIHGEHSQSSASLAASKLADSILTKISKPVELPDTNYQVTCSIGIASASGSQGLTYEDMLRRADLAMYRAKSLGRASWCFFDQHIQQQLTDHNQKEQDLRRAIEESQLSVSYQPIVDCKRTVIGYEALARWKDKQGNEVSPLEFIPLAEQSDLILSIGEFVLTESIQTLANWQTNQALCTRTISINVSSRQIHQIGFIEKIRKVLSRYNVDPSLLVLEITESLMQENINATIEMIRELSKEGIQFALDDFGTGYSSLSYLKSLPIQKLKIDKSFISNISKTGEDAEITTMIIHLAKSIGREVIAEGIETDEQHGILAEMGCDYFQGYAYGKAVPAIDIVQSLNHTRDT